PVAGVAAAESLLASRRGKPREKPYHERKQQRRKPLKRNPHAKRPRESLLGRKQQAGERSPRAGAAKLWARFLCPSSKPRLITAAFSSNCLRVRRRRFGWRSTSTSGSHYPNHALVATSFRTVSWMVSGGRRIHA